MASSSDIETEGLISSMIEEIRRSTQIGNAELFLHYLILEPLITTLRHKGLSNVEIYKLFDEAKNETAPGRDTTE